MRLGGQAARPLSPVGIGREAQSLVADEAALLPGPAERHRIFGGLNERQEHIFTWVAVVVVLLYMTAWVGAIDHLRDVHRQLVQQAKVTHIPAPPPAAPTQQITAVVSGNAPATAYLDDAVLGESGKLRFATRTPGQEVDDNVVAPEKPGLYKFAVQLDQATSSIKDFNVITLVPFSQKQRGKIGLYYLGSWPFERGGKPKTAAYANPNGFIEVTPQNADTQISEHFKLRDFLTKTQYDVWPKYLLLNPKLLDKLELTIAELERSGHDVRKVRIMSGFRTPEYNATGGNTAGRANLSRHMYGDASDIYIDNDGNGSMDDLNHDGRVDARDAEVIQQAVERVEKEHPDLTGGVGVYSACCGHGPFTHIDVRGFRARWRGTGSG